MIQFIPGRGGAAAGFQMEFLNCSFTKNLARWGGAVRGSANYQNCIFISNYAEKTGVNAISIDQYMPALWIKDNINIPVQGNLDPVLLMSDKNGAVDYAKNIIQIMQDKPFIFNLGHGILQNTPIENVHAVVDAVRGK